MPNPKYLSEQELARLLGVIKAPRDKALFTVAYWRGLRASEVGLLQLGWWDQARGRLFVQRLKKSHSGEYPLSPQETRALRSWLRVRGSGPGPLFPSNRGRGISRRQLDVLMKQYGAAAGIPADLRHLHCLKHSIGTHLLSSKKRDVAEVQDWLGHKNIQNTMVYARITNPRREETAREVYELVR